MATIKPSWIATLRHIAHLNDTDVRVNERDVDLRIARALERRRLLVLLSGRCWAVTDAGLELIDADFRPTPDTAGLAVAHAVAEQLETMEITTAERYRRWMTPDLIDSVYGRAELMVAGRWTPCVRNNAAHIGHDEAQGEDCLTPAYGYDGMGGWVHTDGNTYSHDPATAAYKSFTEMEPGDVIAYAGRPEVEIIAVNATETTDALGRTFPAHLGRRLDNGAEGPVPFGPDGSAPVKLRPGMRIAAPPPPEFVRPGNLSYEIDNGQHRWRLEGSGGMTAAIDATAGAEAKAWASDLIHAGSVDGIADGTRVTRWEHYSCDGDEWWVQVLDRDHRDRDRDSARPTPKTIALRIGRQRRPARSTGTGTGTKAATGTGTAVHYLVEKQTGTEWTEVQAGVLPPVHPNPDQDYLDTVADTIRGNVGFVLGCGTATPDVPVQIITWADGIPAYGHIRLDPATSRPDSPLERAR